MQLSKAGAEVWELIQCLDDGDRKAIRGLCNSAPMPVPELPHSSQTVLLEPLHMRGKIWQIGDHAKIGTGCRPSNMIGAIVEVVKINRTRASVKMVAGPLASRFNVGTFTIPLDLLTVPK
jgi:hypothetical protein